MLQLEKSLFDGGASPYDIAMVVSMAAKGGSIAPITPGRAGADFTNVLRAAFTRPDPESAKAA